MSAGVYVISHPYYENTIAVGSSIDIEDIFEEFSSWFLPEEEPKLLKTYSFKNYKTEKELRYVKKAIHRFFSDYRIDPDAELFRNFDLSLLDNFISNSGFDLVQQDKTKK
jgi:hypothetical protein